MSNTLARFVLYYFVYIILKYCAGNNVVIVDNSPFVGYNLSTCSYRQLCPDLKSALEQVSSSGRIEVKTGIYSGSNNTNLCAGGCSHISNITLVGVDDACDQIEIRQTSGSTSDRAIYISNHTFREISCLKISNFTFSEESQIEEGQNFELGALSFTGNLFGGAAFIISNVTSLLISNVTFSDNKASCGGAILVFRSIAVFRQCTFSYNTASVVGGAMTIFHSNVQLDRSIFLNNTAVSTNLLTQYSTLGGAVYYSGGLQILDGFHQTLLVTGCLFEINSAERGGGAIYFVSISNFNNTFQTTDSIFRNNIANGLVSCLTVTSCTTRGGALYLNTLSASISNSEFVNNKAIGQSQQEVRIQPSISLFLTHIYIHSAC